MAWILPLLMLLTACCSLFPFKPWPAQDTVFVQKVDPLPFSEVIIPYAVELKYTKRLRFEDSAIFYDDFVNRFRVIFSSQEILELCEVRDLLVTVVEELLERLNGKASVTTNFDHFPIAAEDLEIIISFESYDIEYNDGTYVAWVSLHDGIVRFLSGLLKDWHNDFWDIRTEPYFKSVQFVELTRAGEDLARRELHLGKPLGSRELEL